MKKILILLTILACMIGMAQASELTYDQDNYKKHIGALHAARGNDPLWNFIGEVDDIFAGTTGFDFILFNPTTAPSSTEEGQVYYSDAAKALILRTDAGDVQLEAGGAGISLDGSYGLGVAIDVDNGPVALTAGNADNNVVLALDQEDTSGAVTMTIASAGTGALLTFDSNGNAADILGSDSNWTITKAGAATFVGITTTAVINVDGADVHFDATAAGKDVRWDDSEETMGFLDDAILGFGNTAAAPDVEISWDADSFNILPAASDADMEIGSAADGWDVFYFFEDAGKIIIDYDADFIGLTDDMDLRFGTGASMDGDFILSSSATNVLTLEQVSADTGTMVIGASGTDIPIIWNGETAAAEITLTGDTIVLDGIDMTINDADILKFGDSGDITFAFDNSGGDLNILGSGLEIAFGVTDEGIDVVFHGETAGDHMLWDEGIEALVFEDSHIKLDDSAVIYFGTKTNNQTLDGDFKMESSSDTSLLITAVVANSEITIGDGTVATDFRLNNITTDGADFWFDQSADSAAGTIFIGEDGKGIDTQFFGDAASSYLMWDQSADQLNAVDSDVVLDDESLFVDIIDTTGTKVEVGTPFYIIFKPTAEEVLTYTVPAAYDLLIIDAWGYKTTAGSSSANDEWLLTNNDGSAANIFAQVELNGVGDGDRVAFTDMDDVEAEVEGGDILTLDADENSANGGADGTIVVSCVLKLAD